MTFSIVAFDPRNGDLGIAVQSKFLAVGAAVPWARAGAGAIATQALANLSYGPDGLELLSKGASAPEAVETLTAADEQRDHRQLGIVDAQGRAMSYTGAQCMNWAGHIVGPHFACQGNILVSGATVQAMAKAFQETAGELAERLVAALAAGQAAGGDRRGQQSAALLVVRTGGSYGGYTDRYIDLRVDDHPHPIEELARVLRLHRVYFEKPRPEDFLPLEGALLAEVQSHLARRGYYRGSIGAPYDEATARALFEYAGVENLEERLREGAWVDGMVLEFLRRQGGEK
jgi:uncharacterized Ntn-hydrolase superfamily protein